VIRLAGEDGNLSKDKFVKIVQGSDFFMKSFDKNKDGEVTEVRIISLIRIRWRGYWGENNIFDKNKNREVTEVRIISLIRIRMERLRRWE
jgi:hypothetical protein